MKILRKRLLVDTVRCIRQARMSWGEGNPEDILVREKERFDVGNLKVFKLTSYDHLNFSLFTIEEIDDESGSEVRVTYEWTTDEPTTYSVLK